MFTKLTKWIKSLISVTSEDKVSHIVENIEPIYSVEAWQFSIFMTSKSFEADRRKEEAERLVMEQREVDLQILIFEAEEFVRQRKELEREQKRKEFREWVDNCNKVFNIGSARAA